MKRKEKHKPKTEVTTKVESITELAIQLHISHNDVACGYLRQPIYINQMIKDNYKVSGNCALDNSVCNRMVSSYCAFILDNCPVYKKEMKK